MGTVGINQENLIFSQRDGLTVDCLGTVSGIYIVEFNVGMDMLWNCIKAGIAFDQKVLLLKQGISNVKMILFW